MYKFDSDAFMKEMEELEKGVEETPLDYEEYEAYLFFKEHERQDERDLRGGF